MTRSRRFFLVLTSEAALVAIFALAMLWPQNPADELAAFEEKSRTLVTRAEESMSRRNYTEAAVQYEILVGMFQNLSPAAQKRGELVGGDIQFKLLNARMLRDLPG